MSTPAPLRRPLGVTVAGWTWVVLGALTLAAMTVVLVLALVGAGLLRQLADRTGSDLLPVAAPAVVAVVAAVAVLAVSGGAQVALGVGVLRGRGGARLLGTAWEMILTVPLVYTLLADIADPTVPLMSTPKALDLLSVALTGVVLVLLWTEGAGAWFRACAAERRRVRSETAVAAAPLATGVVGRRTA